MKILCFIDSLGSGGAQRQLVELVKGFKEKGHDVLILIYHEINFFKSELDAVNIPVKTISEPNYIRRIFKIRKAIRSIKPDAVLSFLESANFMATLSGFPFRNWRLVVGERSANPVIKKSIIKIIFRWFHIFTDYIVANSHSNMRIVQQVSPLLSKKKCKVIYNCIDFNKWNNINLHKRNEKFKLLVVGRYHNVKNADGLIEAIHLLPESLKRQITVHWYGEKVLPQYFNKLIKLIFKYQLDKIIYLHGSDSDIKEQYFHADFVGLFSHYEGFPNTICEAMAMRKPVIVTEISDIPIFIKDSENGFICSAHDVKSIKNALIKAIGTTQDKRLEFGNANFKVAKEHFDKRKILNRYLELLLS